MHQTPGAGGRTSDRGTKRKRPGLLSETDAIARASRVSRGDPTPSDLSLLGVRDVAGP